MKYQIVPSNQFKKDLKLAKKRGKDLALITDVINKLANGEVLEEKYHNHDLKGEYKGFSECHVEPNWLLVYRIDVDVLELFLFRNGSHSDLFE